MAPRQARPAAYLPAQVQQASGESEIVATFIVCDGLGFYISYGRLPAPGDWPQLVGGSLLSRVPAYRAREIGEVLQRVTSDENPLLAASQATHQFGCAFG